MHGLLVHILIHMLPKVKGQLVCPFLGNLNVTPVQQQGLFHGQQSIKHKASLAGGRSKFMQTV